MKAIPQSTKPGPGFAFRVFGILALGLVVRLVLFCLASPTELQSDEANYIYLALGLEHFGIFFDCYRYLWPPLYPLFLRVCFAVADDQGLLLARLVQVLLSLSIGWSTIAIARRLFDEKVALVAGALWVLHLPLASFSHLLWSETLFLALWGPALALLIAASQEPDHPHRTRRLLGYALLAGVSVHLKETSLYLTPVLLLPLGWTLRKRGASFPEVLRVTSLPILLFGLLLLPWSLRNWDVYGRLTVASTLGENIYNGINANHRNFDLIPVNTALMRSGQPTLQVRAPMAQATVSNRAVPPWDRAEGEWNLPMRLNENRSRGLAFAADHPGWFLRSRIQKLSDLVAPVSFVTRHLALDHYPPGLTRFRGLLVIWAVGASALTLLLGLVGLFRCLPRGPAAGIFALQAVYFLGTGSLVAMSRFRLPLVPLLLIGCAALLASKRGPVTFTRKVFSAAGVLCLLCLWWLGLPTTTGLLQAAWNGLGVRP